MTCSIRSLTFFLAAALPVAAGEAGKGEGVHWPSFRGPGASGIAKGFPIPEQFNVEKGEGVLWKTPIPGLGHSSPVVWGDRVFLTTAVREGGDGELKVGLYGDISPLKDSAAQSFRVLCLDKRTGKALWSTTVREGVPATMRHPKSTHANPTPAVDGRRVIAFFGSEGLCALDFEGGLVWKKDLGLLVSGFYVVPDAVWGFASSPVIHDGLVIVQCDVLRGSFLAAFDVEGGREVWRTPRDDVPTWSTPSIAPWGAGGQVIVNGYRRMGGYELRTGREVWWVGGGGDIPVPTPLVSGDLVFFTSAHGKKSPIIAIRSDAKGDLAPGGGERSSAPIAWSRDRGGNYMQTPIVWGDLLYLCSDGGVLSCYRARTGDLVFRNRLGLGATGFTASAVAAEGVLLFTSEEGEVFSVKAGEEFRLLAQSPLGEVTLATPAISEGKVLFRTRGHLIAVGAR